MPAPSHRPHRKPGRKPEVKRTSGGLVGAEKPATVEFETAAGRGGMWGTPVPTRAPKAADEIEEAPAMPLTFPLTTGQTS